MVGERGHPKLSGSLWSKYLEGQMGYSCWLGWSNGAAGASTPCEGVRSRGHLRAPVGSKGNALVGVQGPSPRKLWDIFKTRGIRTKHLAIFTWHLMSTKRTTNLSLDHSFFYNTQLLSLDVCSKQNQEMQWNWLAQEIPQDFLNHLYHHVPAMLTQMLHKILYSQ